MPILHSGTKQLRKDRKRHELNQAVRSELKTVTKQLKTLLTKNKFDEAKTLMQELSRKYDRAVSKKLIHRNTASRVKSRLTRRINRKNS